MLTIFSQIHFLISISLVMMVVVVKTEEQMAEVMVVTVEEVLELSFKDFNNFLPPDSGPEY